MSNRKPKPKPLPVYGQYLDQAAAFGGGLYTGATDLISQPALLANSAGEALGLRTEQEATQAREAILQSLRTPPFISGSTERDLAEVARRHQGLNDLGRAAGGMLGTKGVLRGALGKTRATKVEGSKFITNQASKWVNAQLKKRALKEARRKAAAVASKVVNPQMVDDVDVLPEEYSRVVPDRYIP